MKKIVAGFLCACMVVSMSGCSGSKHEGVMKDTISVMDEISVALESVKDKDSAKAAAPKIEAAADKLEALKKKAKDMGDPSKEEQEKLLKEYTPKLMAAAARMAKAGQEAGVKAAGEPTFMKAIEKMSKAQ
jgi:hypothetical protein